MNPLNGVQKSALLKTLVFVNSLGVHRAVTNEKGMRWPTDH